MKTSKYKIGQSVWFIENAKAVNRKISGIIAQLDSTNDFICKYFFEDFGYSSSVEISDGFNETELYPSKESLLKSL